MLQILAFFLSWMAALLWSYLWVRVPLRNIDLLKQTEPAGNGDFVLKVGHTRWRLNEWKRAPTWSDPVVSLRNGVKITAFK